MTFDEVETKRLELIKELQSSEAKLLQERQRHLPLKDDRFTSELARKTYMESMTAETEARVDALLLELEVYGDRAKWLIKSSK